MPTARNRARYLHRKVEQGYFLVIAAGRNGEYLRVAHRPRTREDVKPWVVEEYPGIRLWSSEVKILEPCGRPLEAAGKLGPVREFTICGKFPGHGGLCSPLRLPDPEHGADDDG